MIEFEVEIPIQCPVDRVFNFVSQGGNLSLWNSAVKQVEKIGDGPITAGTKFKMIRELPDGRTENIIEVSKYRPHNELTIRTTAGPTPFVYNYSFQPKMGLTRLLLKTEIEEDDLPLPIPKFLASRAIKRGVKKNLQTLKTIMEPECRA